jgi:hypothetical protein
MHMDAIQIGADLALSDNTESNSLGIFASFALSQGALLIWTIWNFLKMSFVSIRAALKSFFSLYQTCIGTYLGPVCKAATVYHCPVLRQIIGIHVQCML